MKKKKKKIVYKDKKKNLFTKKDFLYTSAEVMS